jgi:hypothetical protein
MVGQLYFIQVTSVSIVTIPQDASLPGAIGFEPKLIKVFIGTNNTVGG